MSTESKSISVEELIVSWDVEGAERCKVAQLAVIDAGIEHGLVVEGVSPQQILDITSSMMYATLDASSLSYRNHMHEAYDLRLSTEVLTRRLERAQAVLPEGGQLGWDQARELLEQSVEAAEVIPIRTRQREETKKWLASIGCQSLMDKLYT